MSDRIKVNFSLMNQTINEINDAVRALTDESQKIVEIERKMQENWIGSEANKAYDAIGVAEASGSNSESILANINSMIQIQTEVKNLLSQKYSGFEEVQF